MESCPVEGSDDSNAVSSIRRPKLAVNMWKELQDLDMHVSNKTAESSMIAAVCGLLKENGKILDEGQEARNQLDAYFKEYRNLVRSDQVDLLSKCLLLQLIELRAGKWSMKPQVEGFYADKLKQLSCNKCVSEAASDEKELESDVGPSDHGSMQSISKKRSGSKGSGSGGGKEVLKQDLLIRNSDSGKVMGIRGRRVRTIEQLSDTVISFQRVPPSQKDRLLQISSTRRDNIEKAKQLITETILRNTSPSEETQTQSNSATLLMPTAPASDEETNGCKQPSVRQRSHSMGLTGLFQDTRQETSMFQEYIYTGNSTHVLQVSANTQTLLSEAVQALRSHFDIKRSMRRYLPDFEFDESFSSQDSDVEVETDNSMRKHVETDSDSVDLLQVQTKHLTIEPIVAMSDIASSDDGAEGATCDDDGPQIEDCSAHSMISYDKDLLLLLSESDASRAKPEQLDNMKETLADIVRD